MRWHESGFTWTYLGNSLEETCIDTHSCAQIPHKPCRSHMQAGTEQPMHNNQIHKHTSSTSVGLAWRKADLTSEVTLTLTLICQVIFQTDHLT